MDPDDRPIGRLLSRRELLALLGAGGVGMLLTESLPSWAQGTPGGSGCVVRPEQTQGPYFVDEHLERSDIRIDPSDGAVCAGAPLELTLAISRLEGNGCVPLPGARIDLWHCDALGVYSDVQARRVDSEGKQFLRGYQVTDAEGRARFVTIYPGWYPGRTVHIHFKVRSPEGRRPAYDFTSQLYFDDDLTDRVYRQPPYSKRPGRSMRNEADGIFRHGGSQLMPALAPRESGYAGVFQVALHGV
jgi:protocatechuate 3,4-dioxygenase beta subunit